jgi:hypothetical protein
MKKSYDITNTINDKLKLNNSNSNKKNIKKFINIL